MEIITVEEYFRLPRKDRNNASLLMTNGDEWLIERISNQFPPSIDPIESKDSYLITVKGSIVCRKGNEEIVLINNKKRK